MTLAPVLAACADARCRHELAVTVERAERGAPTRGRRLTASLATPSHRAAAPRGGRSRSGQRLLAHMARTGPEDACRAPGNRLASAGARPGRGIASPSPPPRARAGHGASAHRQRSRPRPCGLRTEVPVARMPDRADERPRRMERRVRQALGRSRAPFGRVPLRARDDAHEPPTAGDHGQLEASEAYHLRVLGRGGEVRRGPPFRCRDRRAAQRERAVPDGVAEASGQSFRQPRPVVPAPRCRRDPNPAATAPSARAPVPRGDGGPPRGRRAASPHVHAACLTAHRVVQWCWRYQHRRALVGDQYMIKHH